MPFEFIQWKKVQSIQTLWSGYGEIARYKAVKSNQTLFVKEVILTQVIGHPRRWNTDISLQRKLSSYQNEVNFYQDLHIFHRRFARCLPIFIVNRFQNEYSW